MNELEPALWHVDLDCFAGSDDSGTNDRPVEPDLSPTQGEREPLEARAPAQAELRAEHPDAERTRLDLPTRGGQRHDGELHRAVLEQDLCTMLVYLLDSPP